MVKAARPLGVLLSVAVLVLLAATPAAAHVRVSQATGFVSFVTGAPAIEGVRWEVFAGGDVIEVTNRGPHTLRVLGYDGEPFLRITRGSVEENRNSPATYLNTDRYADVALPPRADPDAPPAWQPVGDGGTHAWHDHRTHWMSPDAPPSVAGGQGEPHLVRRWEVPVLVDGEEEVLRGELWWEPFPQRGAWWVGTLALSCAGVLAARRLPRGDRSLRLAGYVLGAVSAANAVHLVDEVVARPAPVLDILSGLLHTGLFLSAGLFAAWWVQGPRDGRRLVLGIGAAGVAFHQGLLQFPALTASTFDTVWPSGSIRLLVAASLAQAAYAAAAIHRSGDPRGNGDRGVAAGRTMDRALDADPRSAGVPEFRMPRPHDPSRVPVARKRSIRSNPCVTPPSEHSSSS